MSRPWLAPLCSIWKRHMSIRFFIRGLRTTPWSRVIRDIGAILVVGRTPHLVYAIYAGLQVEISLGQYINAVHVVSPFIAVLMVCVLHYRLYCAGRHAEPE